MGGRAAEGKFEVLILPGRPLAHGLSPPSFLAPASRMVVQSGCKSLLNGSHCGDIS